MKVQAFYGLGLSLNQSESKCSLLDLINHSDVSKNNFLRRPVSSETKKTTAVI